jgi:hypothetical protein
MKGGQPKMTGTYRLGSQMVSNVKIESARIWLIFFPNLPRDRAEGDSEAFVAPPEEGQGCLVQRRTAKGGSSTPSLVPTLIARSRPCSSRAA